MLNYSRTRNGRQVGFSLVNDIESNHSGEGAFELESSHSADPSFEISSYGSGGSGIEIESEHSGGAGLSLEENFSFSVEMESNVIGTCGIKPLPLKKNKQKIAEWEECHKRKIEANVVKKETKNELRESKVELRGAKAEAIRAGGELDKSLGENINQPIVPPLMPPSEQNKTDWGTYAMYGGIAITVLGILYFMTKPKAMPVA